MSTLNYLKNSIYNKGSLPKQVLDLKESYKNVYAHGTEGGDSLGISEQLETPQERSFGRRKRSDRSESDEATQDSPPGKRPPVVECAIKY